MADLWAAFLLSFGVIFVAELGDKSQLMAMTFATRFKAWHVLVGITVATTVVHLGSVAIGFGLGEVLQPGWISLVAALAFFGFAVWTWHGDKLTEDEKSKAERATGSAIVSVGVVFFLAELGDKTMLATITLATDHNWMGVWLGSTIGMVAADALAIMLGRMLGQRLPEYITRIGAAVLFVLFGIWLCVHGILELI